MTTISAGQAVRVQNWEMLDEVRSGLARAQKELPPKYFYDLAGSLLFQDAHPARWNGPRGRRGHLRADRRE